MKNEEFKRPYKPELKVDNKPLVGELGWWDMLHERSESKADEINHRLTSDFLHIQVSANRNYFDMDYHGRELSRGEAIGIMNMAHNARLNGFPLPTSEEMLKPIIFKHFGPEDIRGAKDYIADLRMKNGYRWDFPIKNGS